MPYETKLVSIYGQPLILRTAFISSRQVVQIQFRLLAAKMIPKQEQHRYGLFKMNLCAKM